MYLSQQPSELTRFSHDYEAVLENAGVPSRETVEEIYLAALTEENIQEQIALHPELEGLIRFMHEQIISGTLVNWLIGDVYDAVHDQLRPEVDFEAITGSNEVTDEYLYAYYRLVTMGRVKLRYFVDCQLDEEEEQLLCLNAFAKSLGNIAWTKYFLNPHKIKSIEVVLTEDDGRLMTVIEFTKYDEEKVGPFVFPLKDDDQGNKSREIVPVILPSRRP